VQVGTGKRGPLTTEIQKRFFDIITGEVDDEFGWFTWVESPKGATRPEPQMA
jgi:branched-chain amino acid aminotransferase